MVGEDGQTHMGLYDIAYLLAVPNFTVTAPRDGAELIGLLRCALAHADGPFSLRYPRDKAPGEAPPAAEVAPVPDRKSTRLNSSHSQISYAVFCLKKKKHD